MKRCRCCRQTWPLECYRIIHGRERRSKCKACEAHCGSARMRANVVRTRAWKAALRADVMAVRAARAA